MPVKTKKDSDKILEWIEEGLNLPGVEERYEQMQKNKGTCPFSFYLLIQALAGLRDKNEKKEFQSYCKGRVKL